jgi:hypothetical protein
MADTLGKINSLKQFQQTFAARQRMGEILSSAPDSETGWSEIMKDPSVAPWAGEAFSNWRTGQLAYTQQQGEQQKQATGAMETFISQFPRLLANPGSWDSAVQQVLAITPEAVRPKVAESMAALQKGLLGGVDPNSPQARDTLNKNLSAALLTVPNGQAMVNGVLGATSSQDVGGQIRTGVTTPVQGGIHGEAPGQFTSAGVLQKTQAPTFVPGTPKLVGGAYGTGEGQPEGGPVTLGTAGNGKPLSYDPKVDGQSPRASVGEAGLNVLSEPQKTAAETAMKEWEGPGARAFSNAQTTMGLLNEMDRDFDTMRDAGGMLVPGAAARFRTTLASYANMIAQATDSKSLPFDPKAIASIESLTKDTKRLGLSVLTTMLGNQREAAETINNITGAVPNIENTYLGGKLLIASIRAATERAINQREFENAWQADPQNQGNLTGSDIAFNKKYPATEYADRVLNSFGLDKTGFKDSGAVISAYNKGWLTKQQAHDIIVDEGFDTPRKK